MNASLMRGLAVIDWRASDVWPRWTGLLLLVASMAALWFSSRRGKGGRGLAILIGLLGGALLTSSFPAIRALASEAIDRGRSLSQWLSPAGWRTVAAAILLFVSLVLSLPDGFRHGPRRRVAALLTGLVGLASLWWAVPRWGTLTSAAGFWVFAALVLASAAATISARSPVYSAIWFAVSLLGVAGLLLLQGAQFLGIATVAVYAGAIVVTFLFVLMLAQPEGHAYYDRVSWGTAPRCLAVALAILFAVLMATAVTRPDREVLAGRQMVLSELRDQLAAVAPGGQPRAVRYESWNGRRLARVTLALPADQRSMFDEAIPELQEQGLRAIQRSHADWEIDGLVFELQDIKTPDHTAHLGSQLFSRYLIAVQAAGALLMAALVGAVAIAGRTGALEDENGPK